MEKHISEIQLFLYKKIDEILFLKWNPIGVPTSDSARDEYQSYVPRVFAYAMESDSPKPIAKYLGVISTENMGLSSNPSHDMKIAKMIIEVKKSLKI